LDAVKWLRKLTAFAAGALAISFKASRKRSTKILDYLDLEIRRSRRLEVAGEPTESSLDVDTLTSIDELRLIVSLHLDGWTWKEINRHLHGR
jgi:hypothetical protein